MTIGVVGRRQATLIRRWSKRKKERKKRGDGTCDDEHEGQKKSCMDEEMEQDTGGRVRVSSGHLFIT